MDVCNIRYLASTKKWDLLPDAPDEDIETTLRLREHLHESKIGAKFEHHDRTAGFQIRAASHVVDAGLKSAVKVA